MTNEGGNDDGQTDNPYDFHRTSYSVGYHIEMIPGAPSDSKDKESDAGTDDTKRIQLRTDGRSQRRIRSQGRAGES
ncbi:MAG: hypothetical protein ACLTR6_12650 [Clostridium fessum]